MKTFRLFFLMLIIALLGFNSSLSQEYCTPFFSATQGGSADKFTGITNVKINSQPAIDNSSDYNDYYVYFSELEAAGLKAGEEYEITIKVKWNIDIPQFGHQPQVYAWIDWDQNFVFDVGEEIVEIANLDSIPFGEERETTFKFNVPVDAKSGITRLRISEDMAVSDGHPKIVACGYSESHNMGQHGNVEDYNVEVLSSEVEPAKILISSDVLDFGEVEINTKKVQGGVKISNTGGQDLIINSMTFANSTEVFELINPEDSETLEVSDFPIAITNAGDDKFELTLEFSPTELTAYSAKVLIETNIGEYNIDIKGSGDVIKSLSDFVKDSQLNISVNPNPITSENASLTLNLGGEASEIELFIVDLNGNIVQRIDTEGVSNGENKLRFSTANLSSGSYFLISEYMGVKNMTTIVIAK